MKIFVAKVTFKGEFPLDMLRYDRASPSTSEDVLKIRHSFDFDTRSREPVEVEVVKYAERNVKKAGAFTVRRWESFGAKVEDVRER